MHCPFGDAVQEFKVETNNFRLSSARAGSVTPRSRRHNQFHGVVLNSCATTSSTRTTTSPIWLAATPTIPSDQFGATLGGPSSKEAVLLRRYQVRAKHPVRQFDL